MLTTTTLAPSGGTFTRGHDRATITTKLGYSSDCST